MNINIFISGNLIDYAVKMANRWINEMTKLNLIKKEEANQWILTPLGSKWCDNLNDAPIFDIVDIFGRNRLSKVLEELYSK